jgi:hypothetical protein
LKTTHFDITRRTCVAFRPRPATLKHSGKTKNEHGNWRFALLRDVTDMAKNDHVIEHVD